MASCGTCTLCCDLFEVPVLEKPSYSKCQHCDNGCLIQDTKPDFCRSFDCAYAQMEQVSINMRPDMCGVIFEKLSDTLFYGLCDPNRINYPGVNEQLANFIKQGISTILVHRDNGRKVIAADGIEEEEILEQYREIMRTEHGIFS